MGTRTLQRLTKRKTGKHSPKTLSYLFDRQHSQPLVLEDRERPQPPEGNPVAPIQTKGLKMHYRNGREAKNGDKIVKLEGGKVVSFGVLHSATPGNDYCNGNIAVIQQANDYACMCDCLHIDDMAAMLAEQGLDKRPQGK